MLEVLIWIRSDAATDLKCLLQTMVASAILYKKNLRFRNILAHTSAFKN